MQNKDNHGKKYLPLMAWEKRELDAAQVALAKALNDAGAGHVVSQLAIAFNKTSPGGERSPSYHFSITANEDLCRFDTDEPAVAAIFSVLAHSRGKHPAMRIDEEPLRVHYEFTGTIENETRKLVPILRNVNVPKV